MSLMGLGTDMDNGVGNDCRGCVEDGKGGKIGITVIK